MASEVILMTSGRATICRILDIDDMDSSKQQTRFKKSTKTQGPVTAATIVMGKWEVTETALTLPHSSNLLLTFNSRFTTYLSDQLMAPIIAIQTAIRNIRDGHEEIAPKESEEDDEDSDDDEAVAKKEKKLRDELQRKARARARWQKVRESLPLIVQSGLESTNTNFTGITELLKPKISKMNIMLHDDHNRRRAANPQNVTR